MEDKNKFYSLWKEYLKIISPKYQELEEKRLKSKKEFFKQPVLVFVIVFIAVFIITFFDSWFRTFSTDEFNLIGACLIACFFACLFAAIWAKVCAKSYRSDLKSIVINRLLAIFGNNIYHCQNSVENKESFLLNNSNLRKSELFFEFNKIEFDDIIYGEYNDINFTAAEAEMAMTSYRNRTDIFKGIILAYQIKKHTKSNTIVATKNVLLRNNSLIKVFLIILSIFSLSFIKGIIDAVVQDSCFVLIFSSVLFIAIILSILLFYSIAKHEGYYNTFKNVVLEDPKFNKHYRIYSSDQIEARYFLTPAFMERFYNLEKIFKAKNIKCSFYEDRLIIAINTKKDLFEIGDLFKSVKDSKSIRQFYEEINSIFDVIDTLKLDG